MRYTVTTESATEPVTLTEACRQVSVVGSDYDTELEHLITVARESVEYWLNRSLIERTVTAQFDSFTDPVLIDQYNPVVSGSITYVDTDGATQTLSTDVYQLDTSGESARIYRKYDQVWPDVRSQPNAITATLEVGYGEDDHPTIPVHMKHAILLMISDGFEYRDSVGKGQILDLPMSVKRLLWQGAVVRF